MMMGPTAPEAFWQRRMHVVSFADQQAFVQSNTTFSQTLHRQLDVTLRKIRGRAPRSSGA